MYSTSIKAGPGYFSFIYNDDGVVESFFEDEASFGLMASNDFGKGILGILREYFEEGKELPDVKLLGKLSNFQKDVYSLVRNIPSGETRSYGEIVAPNYARAVGTAMAKNNHALFVPCHRVVGGKNKLCYRWGGKWKEFLLEVEKLI